MDVASFLKNFKKERQTVASGRALESAGSSSDVSRLHRVSAEETAEGIVFSSESDGEHEETEGNVAQDQGREMGLASSIVRKVRKDEYKANEKHNQEYAPLKVLATNEEVQSTHRRGPGGGVGNGASNGLASLMLLHGDTHTGHAFALQRKRTRSNNSGSSATTKAAEILRAELLKEREKLNRSAAVVAAATSNNKVDDRESVERAAENLKQTFVSVDELFESAAQQRGSSPASILDGLPPLPSGPSVPGEPQEEVGIPTAVVVTAAEVSPEPSKMERPKSEENTAAQQPPLKKKKMSLFAMAKGIVADGGNAEDASAESLNTRKF